MKKISLIIYLTLICSVFSVDYAINTKKSQLYWVGKKITGSEHNGSVKIKSGKLTIKKNSYTGKIIIDMNSIKCLDIKETDEDNQELVGHLKSNDFFAVKKYPTATLIIKSAKKLKAKKNLYTVKGTMTIRGITKPITFNAKIDIKKKKISSTGSLTIDRSQFNVRYNSSKFFKNLADKVINDDFTLDFKIYSK